MTPSPDSCCRGSRRLRAAAWPATGRSLPPSGRRRRSCLRSSRCLPVRPPSSRRRKATRPAAIIAESFDGLGVGFEGPQGTAAVRNPSDNSLAVGPDHIVQTVNSRMAIFTKKGKRFDTTGRVLYGPVNTNNVFKGFGGTCEAMNNGDAVVRYDQLADRWLIVMPIFRRAAARPDQPADWTEERPRVSEPAGPPGTARAGRPCSPRRRHRRGAAGAAPRAARRGGSRARPGGRQPPAPQGPYAMCYAVSTGPGSVRAVLPLRVPAAALPRLSAAGHLARRLLRADEHRRRPDLRDHRDAEARLRRRPGEDAARRAGHRAVRRAEQRRLPEQRRRRRQGRCRPRARRTS